MVIEQDDRNIIAAQVSFIMAKSPARCRQGPPAKPTARQPLQACPAQSSCPFSGRPRACLRRGLGRVRALDARAGVSRRFARAPCRDSNRAPGTARVDSRGRGRMLHDRGVVVGRRSCLVAGPASRRAAAAEGHGDAGWQAWGLAGPCSSMAAGRAYSEDWGLGDREERGRRLCYPNGLRH